MKTVNILVSEYVVLRSKCTKIVFWPSSALPFSAVEVAVLPEPLQCSVEREGRTKEMEGNEREENGKRKRGGKVK